MSDLRGNYVQWAAAVTAMGGVVTDAPHVAGNVPAARFPVSVVFPDAPLTNLGPGFTRQPDDWADSGQFVYYLAPTDAQAYADSQMLQAGEVPGEYTGNPAWYDAAKGIVKEIAVGTIVAIGVAYVLRRKL